MPFEYDVSYHATSRLTLVSGRSVTLKALSQHLTYGGLLEGVPAARMNDQYIQSAMERARARSADGSTPYLLPPTRRNYLREPGDMRGVLSVFGEPEWLPMVTTIAQLWDTAPARDRGMDASTLTVVWFQDDYGLPAGEVADALRAMDWDVLAFDVQR